MEEIIESFAAGCEKELTTYCKDVTPGEGRIVACLYAHGDKVSGQCEYALYDAVAQLQRALSTMAYLANECNADLDKVCGKVEMGEGRVLTCLKENQATVTPRCSQAMDDIDLQVN